jgi:hypothetical protein
MNSEPQDGPPALATRRFHLRSRVRTKEVSGDREFGSFFRTGPVAYSRSGSGGGSPWATRLILS